VLLPLIWKVGYLVVIPITPSDVFVDYLRGSSFYDDVPYMVEKFDKATKLGFRTPNDPQYIRFGNVRDRDPTRGIRAGQLRLEG
jgi:hypothetical protein